jgi:hypothetical protein
VGLVFEAIGEQHDIARSQAFNRDRHYVENLSVLNRGVHAAPACPETKADAFGKQALDERAKQACVCFVFSHGNSGSPTLRFRQERSETNNKEPDS